MHCLNFATPRGIECGFPEYGISLLYKFRIQYFRRVPGACRLPATCCCLALRLAKIRKTGRVFHFKLLSLKIATDQLHDVTLFFFCSNPCTCTRYNKIIQHYVVGVGCRCRRFNMESFVGAQRESIPLNFFLFLNTHYYYPLHIQHHWSKEQQHAMK